MSGVTDTLLAIAASAGASRVDEALTRVVGLRERHHAAASDLCSGDRRSTLAVFVDQTFDQLDAIVRALAVLREVSPRTLDAIAAMGELLSSRVVAAALAEAAVPSHWVDARVAIVTTADHTCAVPLDPATRSALRQQVLGPIDAGHVPVLGGFVGATEDGHTTTLGRVGGDYSGAIVG